MLGFSAIADAPIAADNREDQYLVLASQSLTLTLSSAAISAGVTQTLASQSLITTLNSPTVQAAANYALQSQNLTLTENSASPVTDQTIPLTAETPLSLTLNSVAISTDVSLALGSQSLTLTLNDSIVQTAVTRTLQSQNLTLSESSVSVVVEQNAVVNVTGESLNLALAPSVAGDDCAIASTTICDTPHVNPVLSGVSVSTSSVLNITGESLNLALAPSVAGDDCAIASTTICDTPHVNPVLSGVFVHASAVFTATQYFLNATYNQPTFSQSSSISVESQTVLSTLNSLIPSQTVVVGSLNLTATTSAVSVFNGHTIQLASQTLYTTLNGFRIWKIVPTTQLTSCNGYTPGTWKNVVVTNLLGGSNAAIDDQPIATIPENAVPVDIPYQTWTSVDTATTTTWKKTIT